MSALRQLVEKLLQIPVPLLDIIKVIVVSVFFLLPKKMTYTITLQCQAYDPLRARYQCAGGLSVESRAFTDTYLDVM